MNRTSSRRGIRVIIATFLVAACSDQEAKRADTVAIEASRPAGPARTPFRVPQESEIKDSVTLASVRRGRALIQFTRDSLPNNVRASLTCGNCHVGDGTQREAMPLVGSYARFPQYRARSGRVDVLEDRINDCFERSMNGKALDRSGRDMHDIIAYLAFLSLGMPVGVEMEGQGMPRMNPLPGDTVRGRQVYASSCVVCHGADGAGTVAAPPLWGPKSYNIGAGMARVNTAAAFIHKVMPRDKPGTLSPQQAFDVAAYINSRPRPDFSRKGYDWPSGGAPPDVAYPTRAARKSAGGH